MATANRTVAGRRRIWPSALLAVGVLIGTVTWFYWGTISGYTVTGTAYGARTACSCRYIAGRPLGDCEKDFEPGMELVFLSEDEDEKSVTASVPLLASATAHYQQGFGCVLEPWKED
jgi:hypothetical protein